jgi:hypothetical protein
MWMRFAEMGLSVYMPSRLLRDLLELDRLGRNLSR